MSTRLEWVLYQSLTGIQYQPTNEPSTLTIQYKHTHSLAKNATTTLACIFIGSMRENSHHRHGPLILSQFVCRCRHLGLLYSNFHRISLAKLYHFVSDGQLSLQMNCPSGSSFWRHYLVRRRDNYNIVSFRSRGKGGQWLVAYNPLSPTPPPLSHSMLCSPPEHKLCRTQLNAIPQIPFRSRNRTERWLSLTLCWWPICKCRRLGPVNDDDQSIHGRKFIPIYYLNEVQSDTGQPR